MVLAIMQVGLLQCGGKIVFRCLVSLIEGISLLLKGFGRLGLGHKSQ